MGRALGVADSQALCQYIVEPYIATLVTQKIWVSPGAYRVSSIVVCPRVSGNNGSAVTLAFYKSASAIAVGSGTILHYSTADLKGTADTNQTLILVPNGTGVLDLVAGDSLGYVLTGTATAAVGVIVITVSPIGN